MKHPIISPPVVKILIHRVEDDAARYLNPGVGIGHAYNVECPMHEP
jgi:hypothetical protein